MPLKPNGQGRRRRKTALGDGRRALPMAPTSRTLLGQLPLEEARPAQLRLGIRRHARQETVNALLLRKTA